MKIKAISFLLLLLNPTNYQKPLIKIILVQKAISNPGNKPSNKIVRQFRLNSTEAAELLTESELSLLGSSKYINLIILR